MRLRERIFPGWLWRLPPGSRQIALTFDDGPHPRSTARLIAALDRLQISSTMFVIGEQCAAFPDILREAATAGHGIALHGYRHESFLRHSGRWQRDSLMRTMDIIREVGVSNRHLFRPPYGQFNFATRRVLSRLSLSGVLWSQMTDDWRLRDPVEITKELTGNLHEGNILVLHDRPATIENILPALAVLAEEVARRGWSFAVLPHSSDVPTPGS